MAVVPKKVAERLMREVRAFQRVLRAARDRDVNESDTVTIVTDMLARVFGFDKYEEVTSELAIRGTFVDLAIKLEGSIKYLVEVKAIGLELKESHLRQAVNYGANHGVQWVVLTNGINWELYRIAFERPIDHELICSFDFLELNPKKHEDQEWLFLLCKKGVSTEAIEEFHERVQSVNRFVIAAVVLTEPVLNSIRLGLRRISPDVKVAKDEIENILLSEVMKREVIEGDAAAKAKRRAERAAGKTRPRKKSKRAKDVRPTDQSDLDRDTD